MMPGRYPRQHKITLIRRWVPQPNFQYTPSGGKIYEQRHATAEQTTPDYEAERSERMRPRGASAFW